MNVGKNNLTTATVICLMLISTANLAQTVTGAVDRSEIEVADPFTLTVTATAPDGSKVQYSPLAKTIGRFQVLSTKDLFEVPVESGRTWTRIYELETYDSGDLEIPPLNIIVNQRPMKTDAIPIRVHSVVEQQADLYKFRDMKDLEEIPFERPLATKLIWVGLGTIATAMLAWAVIAWTRKKQVSPSQWAYAELNELKQSSFYTRKIHTQILPQLADILREYIQRHFDISAPQQTTMEFLRSAQTAERLNDQQRAELKHLLEHVDEIKFAHLVPENNRIDETFTQVESFIEATAKQPTVSKGVG